MRTMLSIEMPTEIGNEVIRTGRLEKVIAETVERLHPEAVYFATGEHGERGGFMVFDLQDPSQIPAIAEPLFQECHARIRFTTVMNADELATGLSRLQHQ